MSSSCLEEKIYLKNDSMMGTEAVEAMKDAIAKNHAVGTIVGYYDEPLTILCVSDYLLDNLEYDLTGFRNASKGSLKNICCGKSCNWMEKGVFQKIQGNLEGELLTGDRTQVAARVYKTDSVDKNGVPVWILAVRVDWEYENYMLINEAIQSGPWYMDCDRTGKITSVNWSDAFRKMIGYHNTLDFPNVLESWSELLHPEDHDKIVSRLLETIEDQSNQIKYNVEYRLKVTDGTYKWFRAIGEVIRRCDGSARRIAGVFINIEREKATMKKLQRADAFHMAFTKANLCEYYVDLVNNSFVSLKEPSLPSLFEQRRTWDELIQALMDHYVCAEDKTAVIDFYNRKNISEKLNRQESELSLECRVTIDGEIRWIRNVIMRDERVESPYVMIFLRDITQAKEEKLRNQKLEADNSAMELLVRSMIKVVDHFAVCDLEKDRYEYYSMNLDQKYPASGQYSEFVRMVVAEMKLLENGKDMGEFLSPEYIRKELVSVNDIYKFEYCSKDENTFRIASFVPIEWEKETVSKVLWISIDVTGEKKIEIESRKALKEAFCAAERANLAKTEFLTNMSHDIRTPMNAIVGLTALAGTNIENRERVAGCLSRITKSSRHLLSLINEVLDMARIESGKISLTEEDFDLPDLVDNLIYMVKPHIEEHKHQFTVNINHIEHEAVYGDSLRIQQIFTNLMSNAIKYTPDGGNIRLTITEKPNGFSELGCYTFCIEDNGIGMSEEFQNIMFQPFTRADDHRTTNIQGTGLGMAITKNIVDMMNGDIQVESEKEKGTKVTVTIYLKLQNTESDQMKKFMNLPVLVVDDEALCGESTVAALAEIGIAGEWVESGEEAVKRTAERHMKKEDYFAIFMDWKMPGMDGLETTRRIRKIVGNEVTIIVLTAYDYSEIEMDARAAGVDAFITKPLFPSRLKSTMRLLVEGHADEKTSEADLAYIARADYSGKRVLLVEDNELNREIAAEIVGMSKAEVDSVENGKEAVERIAFSPEDRYDLILMDIQMPVMNGYEATAAIRSMPGRRGRIPIVAITANAFAEDVQLAKNTGMNGHIAKPLEFGKLNDVLRKWLG